MKRIPKLGVLTVIAFLLLLSCSKSDNNTATPTTPNLIVFKNQSSDLNANALQAQYKDSKFEINFYGNFDANNNPTVIKTVNFQKAANDTIINMTIDPVTNKITSASTTVKGVKQAVVMKFDYLNNATNDYNVSYYNYDWITQTGQLFYSKLITNNNGVSTGNPNYAGRTDSTNNSIFIQNVKNVIKVAAVVVVGVTILPEAALLTAASVITGTAIGLYFDVAVSTLANLVIGDANASDFFPPNTPITNPIIDTANPLPHLQISSCINNNIAFSATMDSSGKISFSGVSGGQSPYTYLVQSGFQSNASFANNYQSGSYMLAVKDANGCVNTRVMSMTRPAPSLCDDSTTPYPTVTIGTQIWMQKNLNVCKYRNGDDIPQVQDATAWAALTTGAWCYYNNDTANGPVYGKLYNWYAVHDPRGLAPTGYHIPTDAEWTTLTTFLGGESVAGNKMKATTLWTSYAGITNTNSSGFTGLPGGYRPIGSFNVLGTNGFWWSASEADTTRAWYRTMNYNYDTAFRLFYGKEVGFSVRCIKD
jgi:uncharacterized protein (TIGR02145 family)